MSNNRLANKLLLIGLDAADWQILSPLIDAGRLPHFAKLVERGAMGNLATLKPALSPMLWTSIATGKTADRHGILGFLEPLPDGSGVRSVSSTTRTTKALWNICTQSNLKTHVVNWYASHPAEPVRGIVVSDQWNRTPPPGNPDDAWPMADGAIHPASAIELIAPCRIHPAEMTVQDLRSFIPRLLEINPAEDRRPFKLLEAVRRNASVHAAATTILESEPWDVCAVFYDLLDVVGHDFMPYRPPRLAAISQRDVDFYGGVIDATYEFVDAIVGRLIELAGEDATIMIVSDHGFQSGPGRPVVPEPSSDQPDSAREFLEREAVNAALWHRHFGIVLLAGNGIKSDERIYGSTVLDITPTALALLGVPAGADMDGRVLVTAFQSPPAISRIASWDLEEGFAGTHSADLRVNPIESAAATEHLISLGYLAERDANEKVVVERTIDETRFNLALTHLHFGRAADATPLLRALHEKRPDESRYTSTLAKALLDQSFAKDALPLLAKLSQDDATTRMMSAAAHFAIGDIDQARAQIDAARTLAPTDERIDQMIGQMHLARREWADAENAFRSATRINPDLEQSQYGLANSLYEQGKFEAAIDPAMTAIALVQFFPQAHHLLGRILCQIGEADHAIRSIEIALEYSPGLTDARRDLIALLKIKGDVINSMRHERALDTHRLPDAP